MSLGVVGGERKVKANSKVRSGKNFKRQTHHTSQNVGGRREKKNTSRSEQRPMLKTSIHDKEREVFRATKKEGEEREY